MSKTEDELTPLTFKIYTYILKRNPEYVKIAQIKHDLGISSQLANYHLQKLIKLGYIEHQKRTSNKKWEEWGYRAKKLAPIQPLKPYMLLANRFLIPRQAIYVIIFMVLLCLSWLSPYPRIIQALCIIPLIINLYDLYKQQQKL